MKRARIEYQIEGGERMVTFETAGVLAAGFPSVPVLLVQVRDAEDSDALVALIEKHDKANGAPKKRKPRTATKQAATLPPAPKCIVAGCPFDADTFSATDSDLCRDHASATAEQKASWRALNVTPPARGKRKAAEIVKQIEGGGAETKASA